MSRKTRFNRFQLLALATQLGFYLATPLLIGVAGGAWLDKKLITGHLFALFGVFGGLLFSGILCYKELKRFLKKD